MPSMETFRRYLFCKGTKKSWIFGMIRGILWFFENWEGGGRKQRCPTGSGRPLRDCGSGGGRPAEKRGRIQERLFSFCKIRIVNSYLILFFIEFFFHFICLFQKKAFTFACVTNKENIWISLSILLTWQSCILLFASWSWNPWGERGCIYGCLKSDKTKAFLTVCAERLFC